MVDGALVPAVVVVETAALAVVPDPAVPGFAAVLVDPPVPDVADPAVLVVAVAPVLAVAPLPPVPPAEVRLVPARSEVVAVPAPLSVVDADDPVFPPVSVLLLLTDVPDAVVPPVAELEPAEDVRLPPDRLPSVPAGDPVVPVPVPDVLPVEPDPLGLASVDPPVVLVAVEPPEPAADVPEAAVRLPPDREPSVAEAVPLVPEPDVDVEVRFVPVRSAVGDEEPPEVEAAPLVPPLEAELVETELPAAADPAAAEPAVPEEAVPDPDDAEPAAPESAEPDPAEVPALDAFPPSAVPAAVALPSVPLPEPSPVLSADSAGTGCTGFGVSPVQAMVSERKLSRARERETGMIRPPGVARESTACGRAMPSERRGCRALTPADKAKAPEATWSWRWPHGRLPPPICRTGLPIVRFGRFLWSVRLASPRGRPPR
jgi:hypothetical protein